MLMKINGRTRFFNRDIVLTKERPGHWSGTVSGSAFEIVGGRQSGGTSREWFVDCPDFWSGSIFGTSLIACLKLLDGA